MASPTKETNSDRPCVSGCPGCPLCQRSSNQNIDPNIAEVRAALSCWRHGTWSKAYAMEQFEKLLQGFVDRGPVETAGKQWRCFHCDEVFTTESAAMLHFGKSEHREAACTVDVARLRDMEDQLQSYRNEDTELYRQIYKLQSDHAIALRREEEKGYARGLADCRQVCTGKHGSQVPCVESSPEEPFGKHPGDSDERGR